MPLTLGPGITITGGMTFTDESAAITGKLYTWGRISQGLNLTGVDAYKSSPTQVGTDTNWSLISAGAGQFAAFIRGDGTLWTTGTNSNGQLGQNNRVNQSSPTQVGSGTNWSWVSAGTLGMVAVKTDGTLWTWGGSNFGFSGLSSVVERSSPTQVGSLTNWSRVSAGTYNVVAIKTDGTLWAWGLNNYGQLGQNNQIHRSSPVQVGSDTNWSNAAISDGHMLAVKTTGTLWGAGQNDDGQLGRNNNWTFTMSSPVQIGSDTNWSDVSISSRVSFAIKTTGTLWSWGYNESGGLGQNDRTLRSSPVQVGAATDWSRVSVGVDGSQYSSVLAVKTNKTLWSWGVNSFWQLGQNNNISRSSPVQVGSATDWNLVSIRGYVSLATTI